MGSNIAAMTRLPRQRLRIALAVIFCLLFQQAALAAYFCPMEQMPAEMSAMAEHCAEMGMQQAQDNPALCAKHCAPDLSTSADHVKLSVPALAMLPPIFDLHLAQPFSHVAMETDVRVARSDPPPRLRFCSLLI